MSGVLELRGVSKTYLDGADEVHALREVDLAVEPGRMAVGIAAVVALSAAVTAAKAAAPTGGNLPADQIVVWLSREAMNGPVPTPSSPHADAMRKQADAIAADLHATSVLPLTGAVDPNQPLERGGRAPAVLSKPHAAGIGEPGAVVYSRQDSIPLFVATPELLAHYGIDPASINASTDLLTPRATIDGYDLIPGRSRDWHPTLQHARLPSYTSLPNILITTHGMTPLHLTTIPVGWLIDAPHALTAAWCHREMHWLAHPPVRHLAAILIGLPIVAYPSAVNATWWSSPCRRSAGTSTPAWEALAGLTSRPQPDAQPPVGRRRRPVPAGPPADTSRGSTGTADRSTACGAVDLAHSDRERSDRS